MSSHGVVRAGIAFLVAAGLSAAATDQTQPGAGNQTAEAIARKSPLIRRALARLTHNANSIQSAELRRQALDAFTNPQTCVAHRASLTEIEKQKIVRKLIAEKLLRPEDGGDVEGGAQAGIFPPVLKDGSGCPQLALQFAATPGSGFGSHHSYPGGLAVHEAVNQQSGKDWAENYRAMYLPGLPGGIDQDVVLAAPVFHDWAKTLVFQWNADGTEFKEMVFGGLGSNDNNGQHGDSRTGAHHILGLAESMARQLSPLLVITQASAHAAPTLGNEYKVVNWVRAAAIIARVDPLARGFLVKGKDGYLRLPNMRIEYQIDNLSDADFVNSVPAAALADELLKELAPKFGFDATDGAVYNNRFRNVVLAQLGAERLEIAYRDRHLAAVEQAIRQVFPAR